VVLLYLYISTTKVVDISLIFKPSQKCSNKFYSRSPRSCGNVM